MNMALPVGRNDYQNQRKANLEKFLANYVSPGMAGAGGYREHDILVIKENSAENISKFPFGPKKNIIKN